MLFHKLKQTGKEMSLNTIVEQSDGRKQQDDKDELFCGCWNNNDTKATPLSVYTYEVMDGECPPPL